MKKITLLSTITFLLIGMAFGQEKKSDVKKTSSFKKYMPSIGIHGGALSYLGDIEGSVGSSFLTYWRPSYGFYLEKKISPVFGVSVNGLFGKISKGQLDDDVFLNFETSITNFDLNLLFDFDNGKIINESSPFAPFISVGVGYLSFNPKGDLFNNGTFYNHWDDGTLRDVAQNISGSDTTSNVITRDYDYESSLIDSTTNYSKTSITIPIRLGVKFEISDHIDVRVSGAYIITMTDYLDNVSGGGNDNMIYTSFGLQYNFESTSSKNDKYKDFSFSELDNEDSDGDGVLDHKDLCQGTPEGVKVDNKGCALDGDKDGVPDYKDQELTTAVGSLVDQYGVTLTDEMIAKEAMSDSVETEYSVYLEGKELSDEEVAEIKSKYNSSNNTKVSDVAIPTKFKGLDLDNDQYISAGEITNAIDGFFEGSNNLSAEDLNDLIDFYFDQ